MDYSLFVPSSASGPVFCDYLDVTCSPDNSFVDALRVFLDLGCYAVKFSDDHSVTVDVGGGALRIDTRKQFHRASASGRVLQCFRESGLFLRYLSLLSEVPHRITRLDAACDYHHDMPDILDALNVAFPDGKINLSRKALKVTTLLSKRSDGRLTGTWYAGHKAQSKASARIYDKADEVGARTGFVGLTGLTRVEFTARRDYGCTLRDAADPTSLYYDIGSPVLMVVPDGVSSWVAFGDENAWSSVEFDDPLPYEIFRRRLSTSPEMDRLAFLAADLGPAAVDMAVRLFRERLMVAHRARIGSDDESPVEAL